MTKLRKTLGDIRSETCRQLMDVIQTQSLRTLAVWAIGYAKEKYLPLCCEDCPELSRIVSDCAACAEKGLPAATVKQQLRTATTLARTCTDPVVQAAARAVAVACAVLQTPTNALGFLFYCAAAVAYSEGGLCRSRQEYEEMADKELKCACASLCACAVRDEKNPVKIDWNC